MATWLKQSTSVDVPVGPFLDETDGKTAETALTITQPDIRLKKNSGAWAQKAAAQTLAHEEAGWYEVTLDATDTNTLGILVVAIHESGALPVWREFMVVPANVWDSYLGADLLQTDSTQLLGTAYATPTVAGVQEVDLTHIAGSTTSVSTLASSVATLLADIGGVATAAADGDPTATDLLFAYIKQLINILIGTAGVVTFPAAAAPANAVSLAEIIRAIYDDTNALPDSGALTTVQSDLDNIQTRLPAALVGGRMDSDVAAIQAGAITAASIAADAIGASELAADAVTEIRSLASGTSDSGSTTTMVDAARTEADADYWKGAIIVFTSGNIAGQARLITGFNAATDTITFTPATTQAVLAQTYEIWPAGRADLHMINGVAQTATLDDIEAQTDDIGVAGAGLTALATQASVNTIDDLLDTEVAAIKTVVDAIEVDTQDIQARLPAALVGGRIDASVGAMAANVLTAAATAADFGTEIAAAVWDALTSGMVTVGSIGKKLSDWTVGTIDTYTGNTKQTGDNFARLGAPAGASVSADIAAVKSDTAATLADTGTDGVVVAAAGLAADAANEIADALLDRAAGVETGFTVRQTLRLMASVLLGKLSGAATATNVFRDVNDTKDRVTASVDADGNRTSVTRDAT